MDDIRRVESLSSANRVRGELGGETEKSSRLRILGIPLSSKLSQTHDLVILFEKGDSHDDTGDNDK